MKTITIGARISEQLDRDLRTLAVATGRSKSWLIAEALKSYVEAEKEFIEAVEEGIKAADEGRLVDHEAVVAELERRYRSRQECAGLIRRRPTLLEILRYIARDNPAAAERVGERLLSAIDGEPKRLPVGGSRLGWSMRSRLGVLSPILTVKRPRPPCLRIFLQSNRQVQGETPERIIDVVE